MRDLDILLQQPAPCFGCPVPLTISGRVGGRAVGQSRIVSLLAEAPPELTEWDESIIRQLVDTVRVISAEEIVVYLQGGMEITQKITG